MKAIDGVYVEEMTKTYLSKQPMESCYIRVYHLMDGSKIEMKSSPHRTFDEAQEHLWFFHPSDNQGADDMKRVDYVTIEQRFSPTPQ